MTSKHETTLKNSISSQYGLEVDSLERINQGLGTTNWILRTHESDYFVKQFDASADPDRERDALRLANHARSRGIPSPGIVVTKTGDLLSVDSQVMLSVFDYVPAATSGGSLTYRQMIEAGATLGALHRLFRWLPAAYSPITNEWLSFNTGAKRLEIDRLLRIIDAKLVPDEFDNLARDTLWRKKELLMQIPMMAEPLRALSTQVIHNDFSSPNILFRREELVAVVDFQPSQPFLVSYEIGRMALNVENLQSSRWFEKSVAFVDAYCRENPVDADDVVKAPQAWLVQLIRSTYGTKDHYMRPHEFQEELDRFSLNRSHACETILKNLAELESVYRATWEHIH